MRKNLLMIFAGGLLLLGACKKKDPGPGTGGTPDISGKSQREIFKMQNWRWADAIDSAENEFVWYSEIDACNQDDIYTFKTGDKISVNEGADDCLPTTANTYEMNWSMTSDNAGKVIIGNTIWDIFSMSNTQIVLWRPWNSGQEQHFKKLIFKRP